MSAAETLLQEFGISDPAEIDLEAIADLMGVTVRVIPLDGCEARITGNGDTAIVAVNSRSSVERQRFSIGHELGHWHFHRHRMLMCQASDIGGHSSKAKQAEQAADRFAADLLMPRYLFQPAMQQQDKINFKTIRALAQQFGASITATAIRCVESRNVSAILVCHTANGRQWFRRSPGVPDRWFPQDTLDADSPAFDVMFNKGADDLLPQRIPADAWFDRTEAQYYEIREQSVRIGFGQILTLLIIDNPKMLEDR